MSGTILQDPGAQAACHGVAAADAQGSRDPLVSVITIFLNAAPYLSQAVESVRQQTYTNWELVLVDDGSTDGSTQIAREFAARIPNVRYMDHPEHANLGMSTSRNAGIDAARGELVAFIDADDLWLPDKLSDQVSIMLAHPEIALVAGTVCSVWESAGANALVEPVGHIQDLVIDGPDALKCVAPIGPFNAPIPSDVLVRKSAIESVGRFEYEFRGQGEDAVFFTKIFAHCPVFFSRTVWTHYRQHAHSNIALTTGTAQGKAEFRKAQTWIYHYIRAQPGTRRDVLLAVSWHTLRIRHEWIERCVSFIKAALPATWRERMRIWLRNFECWLLQP